MISKILIYLYFISLSTSLKPVLPEKYMSYSLVKRLFPSIYSVKDDGNYSIEHVIPQSKYKKNNNKLLKSDMHNLIYYPSRLNLHRSNYKYVADSNYYDNSLLIDEKGNEIFYESPKLILDDQLGIKTSNKKIFSPPYKYRGEIARASMYFLFTYDFLRNIIFEEVIDPYTILSWHHQYPVNDFEIYKNIIIKEHQGNDNIFVLQPKLVKDYMEEILKIDLKIYKNYKY